MSYEMFQVVFSLLLSACISFIISQIYKHTHRGMNYELSFMSTLVLLAPIVTLVMLFIRGDLVLSLGLIGSLSIIRFRTPIKDSRDMVFLFWAIAVGLGAGTYNWEIVSISSLIMAPLVFLLYFLRYGRSTHINYIFIISGNIAFSVDEAEKIIKQYALHAKVRSHEIQEEIREIVFEINLLEKSSASVTKLVDKVNTIKGVKKTSLLSPQLNLPV